MRISVFAWDANPAVDRRLYPLSGNRASDLVKQDQAKFITLLTGHQAIQLNPPADVLMERSARNNLIPYGRVQNRLMAPHGINYPIPAVGARNRVMYVSDVNYWSEAALASL